MKLLNVNKVIHNQIKWLHVEPRIAKFKLRGKYILYDENSMSLWEVDQKTYERADLNKIGSRQKPFFDQMFNQPDFRMIVFQSTHACNLDCGYCFVTAHYVNHDNRLHLDVAKKAIDKYQPHTAKQNYNIGFFGGEPLMNWETIFKIMEDVKERGKKYGLGHQFHITTNATLVTREMAEYFSKNNVSFIVSLDGTEGFHNNNRPYHGGGGTWRDVMRGLEYLTEAFHKNRPGKEVPITLRSTFDKKGVDLVECLEFLNGLMYDGLGSHVSVEPASLGESCSTNSVSLDTFNLEELRAMFEREYWRAADWFLEELRKGRRPSFHHFEVPLQRIYDRIPSVSECGAGKGYISIGPGGTISSCHREHGSLIGNLFKGGIDPTLQAKWLDNRLYNRTTCPDCWRRNLCGGGCRANSALINDNIYAPSVVECLFKEMETLPVFYLLAEMSDEEKLQFSKQQRIPTPVGENVAPENLTYKKKVNQGPRQENPNNSVQTWQLENKYTYDAVTALPKSTAEVGKGGNGAKLPQITQAMKIKQPGGETTTYREDGTATATMEPEQDEDVPSWVKDQIDPSLKEPPKNPYDDDDDWKGIDPKTRKEIEKKQEKQKDWINPERNQNKYENRPVASDEEEEVEINDTFEAITEDEEDSGCCKDDPEKSCGCGPKDEDSEPTELEIE